MGTLQIQDDSREIMTRKLLRLKESGEGRSGADAVDEFGNRYELKSTTTGQISTSRDVLPRKIDEWRTRIWICVSGVLSKNLEKKTFAFEKMFVLFPADMEGFFEQILSGMDPVLKECALIRQDLEEELRYPKKRLDFFDSMTEARLKRNNPHIPWVYIEENGHEILLNIKKRSPAEQLRVILNERNL